MNKQEFLNKYPKADSITFIQCPKCKKFCTVEGEYFFEYFFDFANLKDIIDEDLLNGYEVFECVCGQIFWKKIRK